MERLRGWMGEFGGRAAVLLLALVLCAIPPVFLNSVFGYLPLLALLLAVGLSFGYLQVLKRSLVFSEESLVPSCERGTNVDFVLNFQNTSPLLFPRFETHIYISDLFGDVDTQTSFSMPLMPREKRDFSFQASFDHIGTYTAGIQKIVIYDLLGLFTHTIHNQEQHQVEVLPRIVDLEKVPLSSQASADSLKPLQTLTNDDLDYAGVRNYVWGDPIKTIHWKLSSRLEPGEYLTRLFECFNNPGICIVVDTSAPQYGNESLMFVFDGVVEGALSINQYATKAGLDSVIAFYDKYHEERRVRVINALDFAVLSDALPRIQVKDGQDAIALLQREGNSIHGQDNVAFCTSQVSEAAISAMIELKMRKRNPIYLLVTPPSLKGEELQEFVRPLRRLDDASIGYFVLSQAEELNQEGGR
ncbi:MAG: DUF58 domain-containing protein [Coriobacteriia bacterium]|nr:DUF58 domain-containing protein [Coriobacteriia bacterium]